MFFTTEQTEVTRQVTLPVESLYQKPNILSPPQPPFNVLLNFCALTMIDDSCRAKCWVEMPTGRTVLAEDGAGVA